MALKLTWNDKTHGSEDNAEILEDILKKYYHFDSTNNARTVKIPWFASAVTWSCGPRPWHGSPTDHRPLQKALKGGCNQTRTRMAMEWGGGGDMERGPRGV